MFFKICLKSIYEDFVFCGILLDCYFSDQALLCFCNILLKILILHKKPISYVNFGSLSSPDLTRMPVEGQKQVDTQIG